MANRLKEDERNERAIRNLLKLAENRRCINCNSLGPQYVCTNFWTFVCTTCSGIHREFTHRVKSVSMAKFTSQEVSALQGGGNASAKEIYFKEWDAQRQSFPDGSNVERLRDFIKHVYVDRRYTGERSSDKPPKGRTGDLEESTQSGSRSPPYEDSNERRYSDRPSPGGRSDDRSSKNSYDERRSPGYEQETRQFSEYWKSPARTEVVNDWRREDRFKNGRRTEESRVSDEGSRLEVRSPDHQRDLDASSPPVVRPVRDILGENVSPFRVIEPPKANGGRVPDGSTRTQRTASSSSLTSSNENAAEPRVESSLIDFDAVPASTAPMPQTHAATAAGVAVAPPTASSSADNWANFDSVPQVKVPQASSNASFLESALSDLSVPTSLPAPKTLPNTFGTVLPSSSNSTVALMGNLPVTSFGSGAPGAPISDPLAFPSAGAPAAVTAPTLNSFVNQSPGQPFVQLNPTTQMPATLVQTPANSGLAVTAEKLNAKKALPEDLFTSSYSSYPAPRPGWYAAPPYGFGYNMQYNVAAPRPAFTQSVKSSNPFDVHNEPPSVQTTSFPSVASLQGALPNVLAPTILHRPSSLGTPQPTWMPPPLSHSSSMPRQATPFVAAIPIGSFMGQVPSNMPPRQQGVAGFGFEVAPFGTLNPNQQQGGLYSASSAPNTFSSPGGNPFG